MKKIISILLALSVLTAISVSAFADTRSVTCRNFSDFFDADELSLVIEQNSNNRYMKNIGYTGAVPAAENTAVSEYKEFTAPFEFLEGLSNGEPVEKLISDEYAWMIPCGGSLAKAVLKDGAWKVIGSAAASQGSTADDDTVRIDKINSAIETITSRGSEVKDVICVKVVSHFSSFVCIVSDETYVIPFCSNPDFSGLVNGKLYSASEVYETLLRTMGNGALNDGTVNVGVRNAAAAVEEDWAQRYGGAGAGSKIIPQNNAGEIQVGEIPFLPIILIPLAITAAAISISLLAWNRLKALKNK